MAVRGTGGGHYETAGTAGLGMSQTTSRVLCGHEGWSIPGVAQSISHQGTWRCWSFLQLERAPKLPSGAVPCPVPFPGAGSSARCLDGGVVPSHVLPRLSIPSLWMHIPCAPETAPRVQPSSHSACRGLQHKHFPGGCRNILCRVWCRARLSLARLGAACSHVEQKEVSDTQNSSVPTSHNRRRLFCTRK